MTAPHRIENRTLFFSGSTAAMYCCMCLYERDRRWSVYATLSDGKQVELRDQA